MNSVDWHDVLFIVGGVAAGIAIVGFLLKSIEYTRRIIERIGLRVFHTALATLAVMAVVAFVSAIIYEIIEDGPVAEYQVADLVEHDGTISGKLLADGQPVSGATVHIKIFECGESEPDQGPEFPRTDANGGFSVQFSPPLPRCHVINICYKDPEGERSCWDF